MKKSTLVFCVKDREVLLAMKKRGFGAGKWNGYGGKVQEGESPVATAVRELEEESGLSAKIEDLKQVAIINFYFENELVFECHVYLTRVWTGEPKETEEMSPQWYPTEKLPFEEMWAADVRWLPLVLAGETIAAEINFNTDGTVVKDFGYKPAVL